MTVSSVKTGAVGISFALDNNYMEPIATTLVDSGGVNQITFNDIPQTYKHLQLRTTSRDASGGNFGAIYCRFNLDSGTTYSQHYLDGNGSSASGGADIDVGGRFSISFAGGALNANVFGAAIVDILDYTNTNKYKTVKSLNGYDGNGNGYARLLSANWRSFDSIVSITLTPLTSPISQYSRFSLYGIKG
jgi:hypothetical protein